MKNTKKIFLTIVSACLLLVTIIGSTNNDSLFAQVPDIESSFEEKLYEDKTESTISLNLKYDTTKYQVVKIIQPDKSEVLPKESEPLTTLTYIVKENGELNFEVTYTELETKEVKKVAFIYEVKDIQIPEEVKKENLKVEQPKKQDSKEEQPKKQEIQQKKASTRDLGKPTAKGTKFTDVEEHQGNWWFEIVDDTKFEVRALEFVVQPGSQHSDDDFVRESKKYFYEVPGIGKLPYHEIEIPNMVMYNGTKYTVTEISSGFVTRGLENGGNSGYGLEYAVTHVPETINRIANDSLPSFLWTLSSDFEIFLPDSIRNFDGAVFAGDSSGIAADVELIVGKNFKIPKNANYNAEAFFNMGRVKELIFPEADAGFTNRANGLFVVQCYELKNAEIAKSFEYIGPQSLIYNDKLETLSLWNTTELDKTIDVSSNNADALYLIKSENALDLANDETYKTIHNGGGDNTVYGMVDISTTSNTTQSLKKGDTTTLAINTAKRIGNASLNDTNKFSKDWINGGYTYSITGNTSTSTVVNGDTLTVGSDEAATSFKVKATSKFDTSKTVEFTINVDQTKVYVAQAIDYTKDSVYPSIPNLNGRVVAKFETLQEAFDFKYNRWIGSGGMPINDGSVVIELLTDLTLDSTVKTPETYNDIRYIAKLQTAPTNNHKADGNPSLYTGSSIDGRAVIKRGNSNKGALIEWRLKNNDRTNIGSINQGNLNNIILDGGKSDGLSGSSLIVQKESSGAGAYATYLNIYNCEFRNNKSESYGGAISVASGNSITKKGVIRLTNSIIENCESEFNGGAIENYFDSVVFLVNSTIQGCTAKGDGGAIYAKYTSIFDSTLINNHADGNGGAILSLSRLFLSNGDNTKNSRITNNSAGNLGAGVYFTPVDLDGSVNKNDLDLVVQGNMFDDSENPVIFVSNNDDAKTKGNIWLPENAGFEVQYSISPDSEIGLTFAGNDENGKSKMAPGAIIGEWIKVVNGPHDYGEPDSMIENSKRLGLQGFYRDTNNTSLGYTYADEGSFLSEYTPDMENKYQLVWAETKFNFTLVDSVDNTKPLSDAEFILYHCNDSSHNHSNDGSTILVKDSSCWKAIQNVKTDDTGKVDFGHLSTGQYMLVQEKTPTGYETVEGQYFIDVNNSPNKEKPQSYWDKVTITKRGNTLPPDLVITLDKDNYFESGLLTNKAIVNITYNPMGGTMSGDMNLTVAPGSVLTRPADPVFTGHAFEGWYVDDTYTTEWNFNDVVTSDMTLFAKWNPVVYEVRYDANTGTGSMTSTYFHVNEDVSLAKNTFTKTGFEFTGWNTQADGKGQSYSDEAVLNAIAGDSFTLYAQWKASGPSVFVDIPKKIDLKDGVDGYAKQTDKVRIVKDSADEAFYPDKDILIRTVTSITLSNDLSADTFLVSVFKSDASQYLDSTSPLMTLNVKDAKKQEDTFTLKTKMNNAKAKNLYKGIMNFIIEFRP